jgi:hypothetical protein
MNEQRRIIRSGEGDDDPMTIEPIENANTSRLRAS